MQLILCHFDGFLNATISNNFTDIKCFVEFTFGIIVRTCIFIAVKPGFFALSLCLQITTRVHGVFFGLVVHRTGRFEES